MRQATAKTERADSSQQLGALSLQTLMGCPVWSQGRLSAGQPGVNAPRQVIAAGNWLHGHVEGEVQPTAATDQPPGGGEDPQRQDSH